MSLKFKLFSIVLFLITCLFTYAQPGMPGGPPCWPPPCIPTDGGISIFTFISILFGYKLVTKNK